MDAVNNRNVSRNTPRQGETIEIDLVEVFGVLLHRWWLILLAGIVGAAIGLGVSKFMITPLYQSTTSVYMLNRQNENTVTYSDTQLANQLTKDYEELVTSRYVLENVIDELTLDDTYSSLHERVSVANRSDTRIINITVKDPDPKQAQRIANAIRDTAAEHIKAVMDIEAVNLVDEANLAENPSEPSIMRWTMIGGLIGLLIAAAIILLQYILDDTIKSSEDVERYLDLSTLALIPIMQNESPSKHKKSSGRSRRAASSLSTPKAKREAIRNADHSEFSHTGVIDRPDSVGMETSTLPVVDIAEGDE